MMFRSGWGEAGERPRRKIGGARKRGATETSHRAVTRATRFQPTSRAARNTFLARSLNFGPGKPDAAGRNRSQGNRAAPRRRRFTDRAGRAVTAGDEVHVDGDRGATAG